MLRRYRSAALAGLALVSLALWTGCGKKPIATVNGKPISRERFYQLLESSQGGEILAILMQEEMVLQEAQKQNVMPTEADVTRRIDEAKKADASALQGMTPEEVRRRMTVKLAVRNLAFKGIAKPSEADIRGYFDKNKESLGQREQVTAKRGVYHTQEEAEAARDSLLKNVDFSVVLVKSVDLPDISQQGGALPPLFRTGDPKTPYVFPTQKGLTPADLLLGKGVSDKLFALPDHGVTEVLPCPAPQGFQVIQVQEHRQAKEANYQELHDRISDELMLQRVAERDRTPKGVDPLAFFQVSLIEKAHSSASIQVNSPTLKDVANRSDLWPHVNGGAR